MPGVIEAPQAKEEGVQLLARYLKNSHILAIADEKIFENTQFIYTSLIFHRFSVKSVSKSENSPSA